MNELELLLHMDFPDIFEAFEGDDYTFEYPEFDNFEAIFFNGEMIGFFTFDKYEYSEEWRIINEFYILPEFRGKNFAGYNIKKLLSDPNYKYYFRKPNRAFINVLLKNGLAVEKDGLIYSHPRFFIKTRDILITHKIKRIFKKTEFNNSFIANCYDDDLNTILMLDNHSNFTTKEHLFIPTVPRKADIEEYDCEKNFKKIRVKYLKSMFDTMAKYLDVFMQFDDYWDKTILEALTVSNIIGDKNDFQPWFCERLKSHNLNDSDGLKIYEHLENALERGEITPKSILIRARFLIENFDKVTFESEKYMLFEECPFCFSKVNTNLNVCEECGNVIDKFDMISQNIFGDIIIKPVDDVDGEIQRFFMENFSEKYNYHEFRDFSRANPDDDMGEIFEKFLDYKLSQNPVYDVYFDTLIRRFHYYVGSDSEKALLNLIHLTILCSNKTVLKGPYVDLSSSVSYKGIMYFIDLLGDVSAVDYDDVFKKAVDTFKLKDYLNNEDVVYSELKKSIY